MGKSHISWIKLHVDIFNDEKIRIVQKMPEGKSVLLVWIKLLCLAGKTNSNGFIFIEEYLPYDVNSLAAVLEEDHTIIEMALQTFQRLGMIFVDNEGSIVLKNWKKYQNIKSIDEYREQTRLRVERYRNTKKIPFAEDGNVTGNVTVTQCNALRSKNKNKETDIRKVAFFEKNADAYKLSVFLLKEILKNNPHTRLHGQTEKARDKTVQRWAKDIDLLICKDGQEPSFISQVIQFATADNFWKANILSGFKLRDKWDQLTSQMSRKSLQLESLDAAGRKLKYLE